MVSKKIRMRGGFVKPAMRVVQEIARTPEGQRMVSMAKNKVRAKLSNFSPMLAAAATGLATTALKPRKRQIFQEIAMGQGTTSSYAQLGRYRASSAKTISKVLSEYRIINKGLITSNYGEQGYSNMVEAFSASNAKDCLQQIPGTSATVNTYFEPISTTVKSYFTNMDVGNVVLYLYDYVARRDHNVNPTDAAVDIDNTANGQTFTMATPGQTLFDSVMFTNLFKITKVTKVELRPGQSHIHISKVFHTRKHNLKDFTDANNAVTNEFIRGLTSGVYVLCQSMPVLDNKATNDATGDDVVTFGSTRVAFITTELISCYSLPYATVKQGTSGTLQTSMTQQATRQDDGNMLLGEKLS